MGFFKVGRSQAIGTILSLGTISMAHDSNSLETRVHLKLFILAQFVFFTSFTFLLSPLNNNKIRLFPTLHFLSGFPPIVMAIAALMRKCANSRTKIPQADGHSNASVALVKVI